MLNEVIVDTLAQPQEEYLHVLLIKDILELIFRLLPVHDLLEVRFTCKFWLQTSCCRNYKFQQQRLYQRFGIQLNDAEQLREWGGFTTSMEGKFERMSILNCYAHNLNTASFDEYYWNLGADVFACFVVNLVVFVGKYYYEVVIVDDLLAHIGWTTLDFIPETQEGEGIGNMKNSYAFNGKNALAYCSKLSISFGKNWKAGDVIGCGIDFENNRIDFWLNGELLQANTDEFKSSALSFKEAGDTAYKFFFPAASIVCSVGAQNRGNIAFNLKKPKHLPLGYENICRDVNISLLRILYVEKPDFEDGAAVQFNNKMITSTKERAIKTRPWSRKATVMVYISVFFGSVFTIAPYLTFIMLMCYFTGLASKLSVILWVVLGSVLPSIVFARLSHDIYNCVMKKQDEDNSTTFSESIDHYQEGSAEDDAVIQLESTVEEARNEPQVALEYVTINNDIDDGSFSSPKSVNLEKGSLIVNFDEREEI